MTLDIPPIGTDYRRAIVRDLLMDARCAYRDARRHPRPDLTAALHAYAQACRQTARAIRRGSAVQFDRYGFPVLTGWP